MRLELHLVEKSVSQRPASTAWVEKWDGHLGASSRSQLRPRPRPRRNSCCETRRLSFGCVWWHRCLWWRCLLAFDRCLFSRFWIGRDERRFERGPRSRLWTTNCSYSWLNRRWTFVCCMEIERSRAARERSRSWASPRARKISARISRLWTGRVESEKLTSCEVFYAKIWVCLWGCRLFRKLKLTHSGWH